MEHKKSRQSAKRVISLAKEKKQKECASDLNDPEHHYHHHHNRFAALFPEPPGQEALEENLWTSWCKGRFTEANTPTIRLGATLSGPSSAHLHHPPMILGTKMKFC